MQIYLLVLESSSNLVQVPRLQTPQVLFLPHPTVALKVGVSILLVQVRTEASALTPNAYMHARAHTHTVQGVRTESALEWHRIAPSPAVPTD